MDVRVSVARFPWALKYDCTALCLLGQNSHVIDTRNGKNHTPSLLTSRRPHSRGGITGSAHLKRSAKTPVLGQYAFCFLARNPDMFLTHKQWDRPTEERPGGTSPAHHSVKWFKMVLLESNSQPVIKTGRLKALIEKRIYLFNTSYPDAPKRILLNWLQHYERPRNGSLQKIYYFITMTTFAHPSLAEIWNFVASVTGIQVFTCATNFKLYVKSTVKKKKRKASPPLPAQLQEGVLVQNVPFCLPLQPPVPPCRERALGLTFCTFSLLQCCSHRRNSARKAISCKNSGQRRNKNKTTPCAQSYSPDLLFPFKLWPTKWRRLGTILRKAPFPQENLLSPCQCVQPPSVPATPHFPTVRGCTSSPACSWNWKKTAQGKHSHCLHSSEQSGSSCEWNYKGHGTIPDYEQSAGMNIPVLSQDGQSLLERDSVYLQQRTVRAETLTEKCYAVFWVLNLFLRVL